MSPGNEDFFSFEEALDELRLQEEELKRLVSEGEIRAFRDGDTMKLRRKDVEHLRGELSGGEVVDLSGSDDELVFADDGDLDEAGMATEEISEADTILEDDVEDIGELDLDDEEEVAPARSAPRRSPARAAAAEPEGEGIAFLLPMILTSVVLLVAAPLCLDFSEDTVSDMSRSINGGFAFPGGDMHTMDADAGTGAESTGSADADTDGSD